MKSLQRLRERRAPQEDRLVYLAKAKRAAIANDSYQWLVEAMEPIDEKYTNATFAEGDRVQEQLKGGLSTDYHAAFEYQGSVTSDTHVKFHSDIDLLLLHGVYTSYPLGHPIENPVTPEVVGDALMDLRGASVKILRTAFYAAKVDDSKDKAIAITGGSLTRDVDVVLCHWWNTPEYLQFRIRANRGIMVLDKASKQRIGNKPFLHNWHIEKRDGEAKGALRKAIRLLKNLKYDKEPECSMTSYDIAALAWNMPVEELRVQPGSHLQLAQNTSAFLNELISNSTSRDKLLVPNGTRKIFASDGASLASLRELTKELDDLLGDISATDRHLIALSEAELGFRKFAEWQETRANRVQEALSRFTKIDA
jgi:hypothetical protein